jgi:hypothetical protein
MAGGPNEEKETPMRTLVIAILLAGSSTISAFAQPANVGEPFGQTVVAPAAPVNEDVSPNVPGGLDDVIMEVLADDDVGPIRGHGRTDAPGQN